MKVVEINAYDCGSTGNIMLNIAKVSEKYGIDVYTFSSSRLSAGTDYSRHCYIDSVIDYRIHMVMGMFFGYELEFSYLATKRLIRELKKISPDIIHLHNTHGWYLNHKIFFDYVNKNNIRLLWTLHDCWSFTGRCPHFQITGCDKWKTGCGGCVYDSKLYPASYWADRTKRNYNKKKRLFTSVKRLTFVTPSGWLSDLVKRSFLKGYDVKVINNGINLSVFKPTESDFRKNYGLEDKYVILGVAASWGKRKGFDVFLELAKRFEDRFRIVLVGVSKEQKESLPPNIIGLEHTANQTELAEIYTAADVFANPTREDNFPTVNIEALACGTPVVTFNTGGSPEIIDETSGSVTDCDDIDSFEKEIRNVCENKPYSIENCLKRAKKFDMVDKFEEYVRLYETI